MATQDIASTPQVVGESQDEKIEHATATELHQDEVSKGGHRLMRAKADDFSVWQCLRRYKFAAMVAMVGAFCASLDGYREFTVPGHHRPDSNLHLAP